jgi:hypothetical protein
MVSLQDASRNHCTDFQQNSKFPGMNHKQTSAVEVLNAVQSSSLLCLRHTQWYCRCHEAIWKPSTLEHLC